MKNLFVIIAIFLILSILFLAYCLKGNIISASNYSLPEISAAFYITVAGLTGFIAGFILKQGLMIELKSESLKQVRKAEKADIDSKENVDKIARLNAKIETLEIALKEAIKKNN